MSVEAETDRSRVADLAVKGEPETNVGARVGVRGDLEPETNGGVRVGVRGDLGVGVTKVAGESETNGGVRAAGLGVRGNLVTPAATGPTDDQLYPFKARVPAAIYWTYRGIRTVMYAITFSLFWSFCVLVGWLWLPIVGLWPGARVVRMKRLLRSMGRGFSVFHFMLHLFRLFHRESPIKTLRPTGTPVVLVANHPTLVDVTAIVSLFPNVVAVARSGFMSNPLLARVIRICGFVPATTHVMQDCERRLREGFDVLVFPEGTRSPLGGPLHPFHRGAFELAARAKVPLVLLKLTCTPPALSKRLPIWKAPDRMPVLTIEVIETIYPTDTNVGSREMCRAIEQRYQDLMGYCAAPVPLPLGDVQ